MENNKVLRIGISITSLVLVLLIILFLADIVSGQAILWFTSVIIGFLLGFYLVKDIGWYKREIVVFGIIVFAGIFISGYYLYIGILIYFLMFISGLIVGLLLDKYVSVGMGGWSIIFIGIFGVLGIEVGLIILSISESLLRSFKITPSIADPIISSITLGIIFSFILVLYTNVLKTGKNEDDENWDWGEL
ncbi:MAG: hypothetical protein V5A66_03815 [Candidatus Thermoplasmatota archaeon]